MTTGDRIKKARKNAGLTQKQLAEKIGVAEITIRQYETNKRLPKNKDITSKLADVLHVSGVYLLWGEEVDEIERWEEQYSKGTSPENSWMRELNLLKSFRRLNLKGEEKALNYVDDLTKIPEYRKEDVPNQDTPAEQSEEP